MPWRTRQALWPSTCQAHGRQLGSSQVSQRGSPTESSVQLDAGGSCCSPNLSSELQPVG
jgi:hypothetical protein